MRQAYTPQQHDQPPKRGEPPDGLYTRSAARHTPDRGLTSVSQRQASLASRRVEASKAKRPACRFRQAKATAPPTRPTRLLPPVTTLGFAQTGATAKGRRSEPNARGRPSRIRFHVAEVRLPTSLPIRAFFVGAWGVTRDPRNTSDGGWDTLSGRPAKPSSSVAPTSSCLDTPKAPHGLPMGSPTCARQPLRH